MYFFGESDLDLCIMFQKYDKFSLIIVKSFGEKEANYTVFDDHLNFMMPSANYMHLVKI